MKIWASSNTGELIGLLVLLGSAALACQAASRSRVEPNVPANGRIDVMTFCRLGTAREEMLGHETVGTIVGLSLAESQYSGLPNGWLECDGRMEAVADFPELAAALGQDSLDRGSARQFRLPDFTGLATWLPAPTSGGTTLGATMNQVFLKQAVEGDLKSIPERARLIRWYVLAKPSK